MDARRDKQVNGSLVVKQSLWAVLGLLDQQGVDICVQLGRWRRCCSPGKYSMSNKSGLAARSVMYALLACHQMANYITRLAVPFIVPFIVQEFGFSESQRAMLLNCFTPGE